MSFRAFLAKTISNALTPPPEESDEEGRKSYEATAAGEAGKEGEDNPLPPSSSSSKSQKPINTSNSSDNLSTKGTSPSKNPEEPLQPKRIRMTAGSTVSLHTEIISEETDHETLPDHSWSYVASDTFHLRTGPDYHLTKNKKPSETAYYEIIGVDFIKSTQRIDDIGSQVTFPKEWLEGLEEENTFGLPPIFILNAQVPSDFGLSFFADVSNGNGWSLVLYFRISQDTLNLLKEDPVNIPPSLKLLQKYCQEAPAAFQEFGTTAKNPWAGRFKAIARSDQIEKYNLPAFITNYNAKPVLIRSTGTLIRGVNYMEMDINIYVWGNIARQALQILFHRFGQMVNSIGFCIESLTDEEMPETLFGCGRIIKIEPESAVNWDEL